MTLIRPETSDDFEANREVNRRAFGGEDEVTLVDRLRSDGLVIASLVAVENARIVGHVLFSDLPIVSRRESIRAAALAPMAVLPKYQNRGIGSDLVQNGLDACRRGGIEAVIVLGHPSYYPRFGFSAEAAQALCAPFSGSAFMALELTPNALASGGTVHYSAAFSLGQKIPTK